MARLGSLATPGGGFRPQEQGEGATGVGIQVSLPSGGRKNGLLGGLAGWLADWLVKSEGSWRKGDWLGGCLGNRVANG